jgi:uncharacterized membrane-anchored protein YhcB (DUF1043 family)
VARWDREVLQNGQKVCVNMWRALSLATIELTAVRPQIMRLTTEVEKLQAMQAELDRGLESINTQQEDVHQLLSDVSARVNCFIVAGS